MRVSWTILALAIISAAPARTQTIHRFSLPKHEQTCGIGIAKDRIVVGDDPGIGQTGAYTPNAFTYKAGVFTHPMPPVPAGIVTLTGINAAHDMLAADFITSGQFAATTQSFLLSGGAVTQITWPGSMNVEAAGINDAGAIVGSFQQTSGGPFLGFIDRSGTISVLSNPAGQTIATGINQSGKMIVGDVISPSYVYAAWLYRNGAYTAVTVPGAAETVAGGVNNAGTVSGTYYTDLSGQNGHGYLYRNGIVTLFDVPGAVWTQLGGINEEGFVTGCYADAGGLVHGFTAKP